MRDRALTQPSRSPRATSLVASVSHFVMTAPRRPQLLAMTATLLAALALAVAVAPPAHASKGQEVTFEAPRDLFDPANREAAFSEIDSLGAHALRVVLYWQDVAPEATSRIKPKLDMSDP